MSDIPASSSGSHIHKLHASLLFVVLLNSISLNIKVAYLSLLRRIRNHQLEKCSIFSPLFNECLVQYFSMGIFLNEYSMRLTVLLFSYFITEVLGLNNLFKLAS